MYLTCLSMYKVRGSKREQEGVDYMTYYTCHLPSTASIPPNYSPLGTFSKFGEILMYTTTRSSFSFLNLYRSKI